MITATEESHPCVFLLLLLGSGMRLFYPKVKTTMEKTTGVAHSHAGESLFPKPEILFKVHLAMRSLATDSTD